jgi:hypothetical protein
VTAPARSSRTAGPPPRRCWCCGWAVKDPDAIQTNGGPVCPLCWDACRGSETCRLDREARMDRAARGMTDEQYWDAMADARSY